MKVIVHQSISNKIKFVCLCVYWMMTEMPWDLRDKKKKR